MPPEIGGPASYVPEIIHRLKKSYQFRVVTFTPEVTPIAKTKIVSVSQSGGMICRQLRLIFSVFKNASWADLIFAQDPLVVGLAANIAGLACQKPVVIKYVGDPAWEEAFGKGITTKFLDDFLVNPADSGWWGRLNIFLTKLSFMLAKKIVTPSKYIGSVVTDHYKIQQNKVFPIYNAIENLKIPNTQKTKNTFRIVTPMGRLVKWKKVDEIIDVVAKINQKTKHKIELLILGDGPERESLEKQAKNMPFVKFLGKKTREDGLKILMESNLFVLNSVYEGLPHTVLEAFALSVPVVATDIPGTNEIAINEQTAITVDPGDKSALYTAIVKVIENPLQAKRRTQQAQKLLARTFTWSQNLRNLKNVFSTH